MSEPKPKINFSLIKLLIAISAVIWLGVMLFYINQLPDIHKVTGDEINQVITQASIPAADIETIKGKPIDGVNVAALGKPTDDLLAKGEAAYKTTCASCHGDAGKGDGVAGAAMNPKPRNFHSPDGWINGRNFASMYKTLQEGLPGTLMTAYEFIPVEDRIAIIHYIRKIGGGYPEIAEAELALLNDTYDLSSPRLSASQIPLATAKSKVIEGSSEFTEKFKIVDDNLNKLESMQKELICGVLADRKKAIATLLKDLSWRNDLNRFQSLIADNPVANGFKPAAMKLGKAQISELHQYLNSIM